MNDATLEQLKITVERVVRPIVTVREQKRTMREEMLAHLLNIFDEEYLKTENEDTAIAQAQARFGDPAELTADLQLNVPRLLRQMGSLQHAVAWKAGESAFQFAARISLGVGAVATVFLALLAWYFRSLGDPGIVWRLMLVEPFFAIAFSFAIIYTPIQISQARYGAESQRSRRRALLFFLASFFILPTLPLGVFWGLGITEFFRWPQSLSFLAMSPMLPILYALMAGVAWREYQFDHEWARLRIDD